MKKIALAAAFAVVAQFALAASPAVSQEPASSSSSMIAKPAPAPKTDWKVEAPYSTDVVIGEANAPVTVVEYASLTCPHCAAFQTEKFETFKKEWIDTGKVKFVFRHFPIDQSAMAAAALLSCLPSEEQHAAISGMYTSIKSWAVGELKATIPAELTKILKREVTFEKDFQACVEAPEFEKTVLKPAFDGTQNGVEATPTFFVNGEKIVGFSETKPRTIDDLVAKKLAAVK